MGPEDFAKLLEDTEDQLLRSGVTLGILGLTSTTLRLLDALALSGLAKAVTGVYVPHSSDVPHAVSVPVLPFAELARETPDVLTVAADEQKQEIVLAALPFIQGAPKLIVAGYGHFAFSDQLYEEERAQLLVPSLANGYPHTLPHLYQCLVNAARLGLNGVVAEFGMFKGGTTMFLSRVIERLGTAWPVIGFDSFAGFPPRRSPLDMYDHPECVFTDLAVVQRYLTGRNVEIVAGDIVETATRLANEKVVLTFVDTDNYSSARAALEVVQDRTVVGGAIVFDHFTGLDRFRYTLGERIAGLPLLEDPRFFNLHGTGVFYRQR